MNRANLFGLIAVSLICLFSAAHAIEPTREGQQAFLSRAVFTDGRLWILSDAGELSSLSNQGDHRAQETPPDPVYDICLHEGKLVALTCKRTGCAEWTLRERTGSEWSVTAAIPARREEALALACNDSGVQLLTSRRLVSFRHDRASSVAVSAKWRSRSVTSAYATPEYVFVGVNAGEWGGDHAWRVHLRNRSEEKTHALHPSVQ